MSVRAEIYDTLAERARDLDAVAFACRIDRLRARRVAWLSLDDGEQKNAAETREVGEKVAAIDAEIAYWKEAVP